MNIVMIPIVMHFFCCALPIILSLVNLQLFGASLFIHEAIHEYEIWILTFSAFLLLLGVIVHSYNHTVKCCDNLEQHKKNRWNEIILIISFIAFALNLFIYIME